MHESKLEVNQMLEKMPIASRSKATEKRIKELEEKMVRIDRAIETFSKKKVYIAL